MKDKNPVIATNIDRPQEIVILINVGNLVDGVLAFAASAIDRMWQYAVRAINTFFHNEQFSSLDLFFRTSAYMSRELSRTNC